MKNRLIKTLLVLFFLGLFVYYYIANPEVVQEIKKFDFLYVILGSVYTLVVIFLNGLFLKYVIDALAKNMTYSDSFYTSFISSFANYFLPMRSGSVVRAIYLKKQHNFSYKNFIATLYGNYVLIFFTTAILGLFSLLIIYLDTGQSSWVLTLIMASVLLLSISLMSVKIKIDKLLVNVLRLVKTRLTNYIADKLSKVLNGWKVIIKDKRLLCKIIGIITASIFARAVFYYVAFSGLGADIMLVHVILFTSVSTLSMFFAITPGSIGVRETILLAFAGVMSLSYEHILSATLLDRGTTLLMLLMLFIYFQFFSRNYNVSDIWEETFGSKTRNDLIQ